MRNQNKKKRQDTGFTLIELLAVITIMGILMMVAIPSISNTIKNSRKDTYKSTVAEINNAVKNLVSSDSIQCACGTSGAISIISACPADTNYYLGFTSGEGSGNYVSLDSILDGGAKSPFGNAEFQGYIIINFTDKGKYTYTMYVSDGTYGFEDKNVKTLQRKDVTNVAKSKTAVPTSGVITCSLTSE